MFKYTDDERLFCKVLASYIAEFGSKDLTIHLPQRVSNVLDKSLLSDMSIEFWQKNAYAITVSGSTANYLLVPQD